MTTGRVLKTELHVEQPSVRAIVTTTFRYDDRFGIAVPMEMRERYTIGTGNRVTTVATYGRFRRFDVTAALAEQLGIEGVQRIRWVYAR